ncbi:MAG TPA: ABC transporter permease subunit [Verrucomicrobiae bacterium]|nr:ABC transporter permease subunit [Verrucomicrobiae bacterium]
MTFLPIVDRELRIVARRSSTYWGRVGLGAVMTCLGAYFVSVFQHLPRGGFSMGAIFLGTLGKVAFVYACTAGIRHTADSISQEKRDGTLGLLFLTDLKGYDVAFGKLISGSLAAFYTLLACLPALAFTYLLGGVSGGIAWRMGLALLNLLLFASAVSLMVSTFSVHNRPAFAAATAVLVLYLIMFPIAAESLTQFGYLDYAHVLNLLNPGFAFTEASRTGGRTATFWSALFISDLNAWALFGLASWRLPHVWREKGERTTIGWRGRWRQWCYGNAETRAAFRRHLVAINPFYWLSSRTRVGPCLVWLTVFAGVGLLWQLWQPTGRSFIPFAIVTVGGLHTVLKFWVASEASQHLEEQRRSGALELLLACTPLEPRDILRGQWLSLRRTFFWPTIVALGLDLGFFFAARILLTSPSRPITLDEFHQFRVAVMAAMIVLVADLLTLGCVGMWRAMVGTKPRGAAGTAISQVIMWPWIAFALISAFAGFHHQSGFYLDLGIWWSVSLAADFLLATSARRNLARHFRTLAAVSAEHVGWMGRLGRALGLLSARAAVPARP